MTEHLLELRGVSQVYEGHFVAIESLDLTLDAGQFVALLGPSGCGKSTLLRIITGLQRPTEGQVLYRGTPLQGVNPNATIVFQTFALFPWLTAAENVEVVLKARGIPRLVRAARTMELLDRVGLDGFENAYPRELSGGMRQKVAFARAMAVEPELLCMDEPFSALDVLSAASLRAELLELWVQRQIPTQGILLVTHDIEEAVLMADRIVVMDKNPGRIIADLAVDMPHPRDKKGQNFLEKVDQIYGLLAGTTQPEHIEVGTAPGEPGPKRLLPRVSFADITALLEHLAEEAHGRYDIYHLAQELGVDSDHLLRTTEAAELLGLVSIAEGDILLTPLGEAMAEASITARKEIAAARIRRLPMFRWVLSMLKAADTHSLNAEVLETALELHFPAEEARRQLSTLIDWGRYAEVFAYDDGRRVFYLEPLPSAMSSQD
ncbi:MAG: nitrate/sulfonate/bicarbonate ABC transporter ATP-binding protein [Armatimonadetes bacterium]|nr:nitrate/sulfonate/bicarbonate ABC transporter ATP-binding protein [Armatimonadota bacterium]